eukprot:TRINITY_DN524_c0_g1_i1.p1 TRINITY_DN524_c0_g1~~TRINITY_DN524_c0_g1_i1.p1  ORF type:complete len:537 (+),score=143.46 TRINITY_DN524_c0_g1_i1:99-1709(+)
MNSKREGASPSPRVHYKPTNSPNVAPNYEVLSERVALCLASRIVENPKITIGLTVGTTPTGVYSALASLARKGVIDLSQCHFVVFDEFYCSPGSLSASGQTLADSSHYNELQETFFNQRDTRINPNHIICPPGGLSPEMALTTFKEMMAVKKIDIALIHSGAKGNIGWIKDPIFQGPHVVDISSSDLEQNRGYKTVITLGLENLMHSKEIFMMTVGRNKANTVKEILFDNEAKTPASYLLNNHPHTILFVDKAAAACLPEKDVSPNRINGFDIIGEKSELLRNQNIVCFSPHPDDSGISCGATLSFLQSRNPAVVAAVCTTGHRSYIPNTTPEERMKIRETEARTEASILGVGIRFLALPLYEKGGVISEEDINIVLTFLRELNAQVIFMPQTGDSHSTHRAVCRTILMAFQRWLSEAKAPTALEIYMYEGPWSLFAKGSYNTVSNTPPEHFAKKTAAVAAHVSQCERTPYGIAADSLATLRGALVPEQDLAGFGAMPPQLNDRLEVFFHTTIKTAHDVSKYISLLDSNSPPQAFS